MSTIKKISLYFAYIVLATSIALSSAAFFTYRIANPLWQLASSLQGNITHNFFVLFALFIIPMLLITIYLQTIMEKYLESLITNDLYRNVLFYLIYCLSMGFIFQYIHLYKINILAKSIGVCLIILPSTLGMLKIIKPDPEQLYRVTSNFCYVVGLLSIFQILFYFTNKEILNYYNNVTVIKTLSIIYKWTDYLAVIMVLLQISWQANRLDDYKEYLEQYTDKHPHLKNTRNITAIFSLEILSSILHLIFRLSRIYYNK